MSSVIQFDTSETVVGGVNITGTVRSNQKLVFNESYTVIGNELTAPEIYACYDLTVIGDIQVTEIEVRGNLFVTGNIRAKNLICHKIIICGGNIAAETITASDITANDIAVGTISCQGNIIARTTIDVRELLQTRQSAIAGEGIVGIGQFSAKNAVAAEYVDFQGEVKGKILELATDVAFGTSASSSPSTPEDAESFKTLSSKMREKIEQELRRAGEVDENQLVEFVNHLSSIDEDMLCDWKMLTEELVSLAYVKKITNLRDYFIIIMAAKLLPEEIISYETIEHVFDSLLIDAEQALDTLPFCAKSVEDLAYALKIVTFCEKELRIDSDMALDRIFQSLGIKYNTVKTIWTRTKEGDSL